MPARWLTGIVAQVATRQSLSFGRGVVPPSPPGLFWRYPLAKTILGFVAALTIATTGGANAQALKLRCAPYASLKAFLTDKHGEEIRFHGINGAGWVVEMWANADSTTWTLVTRHPNGAACVISDGSHFAVTLPVSDKGDAL